MRKIWPIFFLMGCENPPPDLDSLSVQNPTCIIICLSSYGNASTDGGDIAQTGGANLDDLQ